MPEKNSANTSPLGQMTRAIWVLGFVSMLTTLGMSVYSIGLIEGIAESTALVVKVFTMIGK